MCWFLFFNTCYQKPCSITITKISGVVNNMKFIYIYLAQFFQSLCLKKERGCCIRKCLKQVPEQVDERILTTKCLNSNGKVAFEDIVFLLDHTAPQGFWIQVRIINPGKDFRIYVDRVKAAAE